MKASELQPGQFFQFDKKLHHGRCLFLGPSNDPDFPYAYMRQSSCEYGYDIDACKDFEVTPLAVTGWDDEPSMSTGPIPQGWACMMNTQTGEKRLVPFDEVFPPDPPKLQLREGAYYRRRDGEVVGPLYKTDNDECPECPWRASDIRDNPYRSWSHDGKYDPDETEPDDYDLIAEAPPVEHVRPAIADAIENAAAAFHQKIKEPEQFAAGDWLYCIESHAGIVKGSVYQVLEVDRHGWPEVEEDCGYWNPSHFRRATPAEVAEQQRKNYWQHPVVEKKSDADGWIEWKGGECPVDGEVVVQCKTKNCVLRPMEAKYRKWELPTPITHYRLVNPPTPELQPIYTTHVQYVGVL